MKSKRAEEIAAQRHAAKVITSKSHLGFVQMFLENLKRAGDGRLQDMRRVVEEQLKEMVTGDEFYAEAAAELWLGEAAPWASDRNNGPSAATPHYEYAEKDRE